MKFDRRAKYAFIVACMVLVASGVGLRLAVAQLNYYLRKEPVQLREHFTTISRSLGQWQAIGPDTQHDAAMIESLGTDLYLDRTYTDGKHILAFHLAYYTGMIDPIPHVPDRCMVAGGFQPMTHARNIPLNLDTSQWKEDPHAVNRKSELPYQIMTFPHRIHGRPVTVRMPIGDLRLRTTVFHEPSRPNDKVIAGFFFIANGRATADPVGVRMLAFDRTDKYAYYCKVMLTMPADLSVTEEQFIEAASSLLDEALPEIMRCLPDWAEIEAREMASPTGSVSD